MLLLQVAMTTLLVCLIFFFMVLSCLEKDKLEYTIHVHDIEAITGRKWNLKQLRKQLKV